MDEASCLEFGEYISRHRSDGSGQAPYADPYSGVTGCQDGRRRTTGAHVHNGRVDIDTDDQYPRQQDRAPRGWRSTLARGLGVVAVLVMVVFWIYVLTNGNSITHPDEFDDPAYVEAAERICADRQAAIAELPPATAAEDPIDRSILLEQGTRELEAMVAELRTLEPPTDAKGAAGVVQWLDDYELYLDDRRDYAEILASGDDPPFVISGNDQGVRVTDMLTTFAEVNRMESCAPSGDV